MKNKICSLCNGEGLYSFFDDDGFLQTIKCPRCKKMEDKRCIKCEIIFSNDLNSNSSEDGNSGICKFCAMEQEGVI